MPNTNIGGQASASAYWASPDPRRLTETSAIPVVAGVINGSGTGQAYDSMLTYVYIPQAATAITLTVAGFQDEEGNAVSIVFKGSTSQDMEFHPHLVNSKAAMTLTASVASEVLVGVRAP